MSDTAMPVTIHGNFGYVWVASGEKCRQNVITYISFTITHSLTVLLLLHSDAKKLRLEYRLIGSMVGGIPGNTCTFPMHWQNRTLAATLLWTFSLQGTSSRTRSAAYPCSSPLMRSPLPCKKVSTQADLALEDVRIPFSPGSGALPGILAAY